MICTGLFNAGNGHFGVDLADATNIVQRVVDSGMEKLAFPRGVDFRQVHRESVTVGITQGSRKETRVGTRRRYIVQHRRGRGPGRLGRVGALDAFQIVLHRWVL